MADVAERDCIGWSEHHWTLTIEEGRVGVCTDPCAEGCQAAELGLGDYGEFLAMPDLAVSIAMATDCPAYDTDENNVPTSPVMPMRGYESGSHYVVHGSRCDCNWWPVAIPALDVPAGRNFTVEC